MTAGLDDAAGIVTLTAATEYSKRGLAPIPVAYGTKRPCIEGWPEFGPDEEALHREFGAERRNIGLLLGRRSGGLVDVDLDHQIAIRLAPSFLPDTLMRHGRASARGSHWWYRATGVPPRTEPFCDPSDRSVLVELRAEGAQTVAPPSVHPTGEPLEWEAEGNLEPARVNGPELRRQAAKLAAAVLLAKHWPRRGSRHDASLALAGMLIRAGRSLDDAMGFVANVALGAGDEEWEARAENVKTTAVRWKETGRVVGAPSLAHHVPETVVRTAAKWLGLKWESESETTASSHQSGFVLVSLADLLEEPEEETSWLVEERLPAGGTSALVAKPKVGKSTIARSLGLAVARGEPWLGWKSTQGTVFYLALEEKRSEVKKHFRAMGATGEEPLRIFFGPAPADVLAQLEAAAKIERPVLIIVDTLQLLVRAKDLNDYAEMSRALEPLRRLRAATDAHVLFVHHARKGRLTPDGDSVLGSTAIMGGVDTAIFLRRGEYSRSLWTTQRYGTDLEETVIELPEDSRSPRLAGSRAQFERGRLENAILTALRESGEPLRESDLEDRVPGRTQYKRVSLRRLVERGTARRVGAGVRGDPFRYALPAAFEGSQASSDSCSLVPVGDTEQETSISGQPPSLESTLFDSRADVPLPGGEQGNKSRETQPPAPTRAIPGADDGF